MAKVDMNIGQDVTKAKQLLEVGQLVGIPTETVYGLAGNGFNEKVVASIFETKKRPSFDPLILHTNSLEKTREFVTEISPLAQKLAEQFWPGPLTLVLPKKNSVPDLVTSGLETVAVRIPNHPLTLQLLETLDFPLAAPSANVFGYISPTQAKHVVAGLGEKVSYVLDGSACSVGVESTIVKVEKEKLIILRKGGIAVESLEALGYAVEVFAHSSSQPEAPGMLKQHYAPTTPILLGDIASEIAKHEGKRLGILSFRDSYSGTNIFSKVLSESGNLSEAAQRLFTYLRELDNSSVDVILSELVPEEGLGRAINDRLRRSAAN